MTRLHVAQNDVARTHRSPQCRLVTASNSSGRSPTARASRCQPDIYVQMLFGDSKPTKGPVTGSDVRWLTECSRARCRCHRGYRKVWRASCLDPVRADTLLAVYVWNRRNPDSLVADITGVPYSDGLRAAPPWPR